MSKKKFKEDKKNGKLKKVLVFLIFLFFISIIIFTGIKIFNWVKENIQNKDIEESISDTVSIDKNIDTIEKYSIDFKKLKQTNLNTIGWIKVYGTNIEYPVVKTVNNDYYMTHTFDKTYNSSGWVFMDYKNRLDGTDNNIVIYAHNRRDNSMFGTLKNILTKEWQNNKDNFIIPFITESENAQYQVFSVYKIEKEDYYITTNFATDVEFQKFIDEIKLRSVKDFEIDVTSKDNILTLSTCADDNRYRVVLHAKKIIE